ncbi:hypothetical protein N7478_000181 [Penicillium angulare]|uniref:uncharacterized protein n=1 Tax=Penicillium angulare TaxID=116970 RepID=UPI00254252E1|nr:uncharacterized protein N7478_000181 [Penicillium angulare]KAJ5290930.1 hypothetical protein N7478_000181 [Penicillium angulare]
MASGNYYDQNQSFDGPNRGDRGEYNDTRYNGPPSYSGGDDFSSAASHAREHHDQGSSNGSFFDNALGFLNEHKDSLSNHQNYDIDEQHVLQSHQKLYGGGDPSQESHDAGSVGSGAALQAMKSFTSGGSSDGGFDKNKLVGMAMAQASKLWDEKQGGGASMSGDKQSAVNNAAEMAMKMYMKSQGGGSGGSGGLGGLAGLVSGNSSGLMGLASKFL